MEQSAADNSSEKKDKTSAKLSDIFFNKTRSITNYIVHRPETTLAVGLILGGIGTLYKPSKEWLEKRPAVIRHLAQNWSLATFAAYVTGITAIQLQNVRQVYRHAVGIELNKPWDDVSVLDLLFRSKNSVVQNTRKQFGYRVSGRISALLVPGIPYFLHRKSPPHPSIVSGSTAIENAIEEYSPMVWDGLLALTQKKPGDTTSPDEIKDILVKHRSLVYRKNYTPPAAGTEDAKNEAILDSFIAHLLDDDRERRNRGEPEPAAGSFKEATFIYLMGNEAGRTGKSFLDQSFPVNLAYVELARQDNGRLDKVKETAHAIADGQSPDSIFGKHGIDMNTLINNTERELHTPVAETQEHENKASSLTPPTQLSHAQETSLKAQNSALYH